MRVSLSEDKRILLTQILIAGLIFFIPLSPTIKSIFLIASLVFILVVPHYNQYLLRAYSSLWGRAALLLFVFVTLACLWSPASYSDQLSALGKYLKLLYIPIIAIGFIEPKVRNLAISSYLGVMILTCLISIIQTFGYLNAGEPGTVVYNYIITGFMIAFGAYIAANRMLQTTGWARIAYLLIIILCTYQVFFINKGRTGYAVYCLLTGLLLIQNLSLKKAVAALMLFCAAIGLVYTQSPTMQLRVHAFAEDIQNLQHNRKNTSLGYRVQFHEYARSIFESHPLIGAGTGGYRYNFMKDNPVPDWGIHTADPHGQYWLMLSEFGITGLSLMIMFLGSLVLTAFELEETRPILLGFLLAFTLGCFSDTLLSYSTAGYLLVMFTGLCFGELLEKQFAEVDDSARF